MKKSDIFLFILRVLITMLLFQLPVLSQEVITASVISNGGTEAATGDYTVSGTVGQAVIGAVSNDDFTINEGFWAQLSFVNAVSPVISKILYKGVGKIWIKGTDFGETKGSVYVNGIQLASNLINSWKDTKIIVKQPEWTDGRHTCFIKVGSEESNSKSFKKWDPVITSVTYKTDGKLIVEGASFGNNKG